MQMPPLWNRLQALRLWLDDNLKRLPQKSGTAEAIRYALSRWKSLCRFLDDGSIEIDNNAAERAIRPFVIGRKNWLFSDTPKGAMASAQLYSLVETAKANGQEPYAWLPHASSVEDFEALLPWNCTLQIPR